MSSYISPSKAIRWEDSQMRLLNQYPAKNVKLSRFNSAVLSIYRKQSYGKWCIQNRVALTSDFICTKACSISGHEKSSGRPSQKQRCSACKGFSSPSNEPPVLEGSSMDEIYDALVQHIFPAAAVSNSKEKYIIGLAGPPGAGKSTVANEVVCRLNALWHQKTQGMDNQIEPANVAVTVPMDGFHLYRSQLDMMEDPKEAYARRGAPWTFDPARLLSRLTALRRQGSVYMPSFDHGVGDPVEDDIFVSPLHKIVLLEGNYLLLEEGPWRELPALFDERWFLDVNIDVAMRRVEKRHISTGKSPGYAKWRVDYNDRKNAELIAQTRKNADLVIFSIESST